MDSPVAILVDEYVASTNAYQPVGASTRGFHEHDAQLGDRSRLAIEERMRHVRGILDRLRFIDRAALSANDGYDADLLERRLKWELTDFEHVRSWQRCPGAYLATIGSGCNGLVIRDFAPLDERIAALTSRLEEAPRLLEQAKRNLADPSRYHVETAIEAGTAACGRCSSATCPKRGEGVSDAA